MRLWHKDFINVLPRQQLLGQLRECVLIAKNIHETGKPNHLLVNPIMDYPISHFLQYIYIVIGSLSFRNYKVRPETLKKISDYLGEEPKPMVKMLELFENWHNELYLDICFYNLLEKLKCGGIQENEFKPVLDRYFLIKKFPFKGVVMEKDIKEYILKTF